MQGIISNAIRDLVGRVTTLEAAIRRHDLTFTSADLPIRLEHKQAKSETYCYLMPLNSAAQASNIFAAPETGAIVIDQTPIQYRDALCQVGTNPLGVPPFTVTASTDHIIPWDTASILYNFQADTTHDEPNLRPRITAMTYGIYQFSFTFSGTFSTTSAFSGEIGVQAWRPDPPNPDIFLGEYAIDYSTSNQQNSLSIGATILARDMQPSDYFTAILNCSSAGTFDPYEFVLSVENKTGQEGAVEGENLMYRLILGNAQKVVLPPVAT